MSEKITLSPRLLAAAELIRFGAFAVDVGTDHAYLPIYLCLDGRICGGLASDINKGPMLRAEQNIKRYGLERKITAVLSDGLTGAEKYIPKDTPTDVMVLGMGGELIVRILDSSPISRREGVRLCLQPMTHPEILRKYLYGKGFSVVDERIVMEGDKIYQLILAEYTAQQETATASELFLGKLNIQRGGEGLAALARHWIRVLERRAEGIESTDGDSGAERKLIEEIRAVCTAEENKNDCKRAL